MQQSFRLLLRNPAFTLLAVFTLALGIGANTAIFTVIDALLVRPLPYRNAAGLVLVTAIHRTDSDDTGCLTWPRFTMIEKHNAVFSQLAAYTLDTINLTGRGEAEQLEAGRVSWNFFDVLGVQPAIGHGFVQHDSDPAGSRVVLISARLWKRRFASAANIAGETVTLSGTEYTIAGVLPASFHFGLLSGKTDVWIPRIDELALMSREHLLSGVCYLSAIGRPRPGVSIDKARAQMAVLDRQYASENPRMPDAISMTVIDPLRDKLVGGFRPTLLVLAGAVAVVLLIACANVASLLLARALARRREVAVRTVLGATPMMLMRQLLTESLVLALGGGLCGLLLSVWATSALSAKVADFVPRADEIGAGFDLRVLAFAAGVSALAAILFGLAPAVQFSRAGLGGILREDARGTVGGRGRNRLRSILAGAQVALSVVMLVGAGLLIRTFLWLQNQPTGFNPKGTLTMSLSLPPARYSNGASMNRFFEQVLEQVEQVPGVHAAAVSSALPVNPVRQSPVLPEGHPAVPLAERPVVMIQTFAHDYVKALGVPLIRGRVFDAHDTASSPAVVVVNQAFARQFFSGQDALGRHVSVGRRGPAEIVGIIGDVKNAALTEAAAPEVDLPFAQLPWPSMNLTVRTDGDPLSLGNAIRAQIAGVDRDVPVTDMQTLDDVLSASRARPRAMMTLLAVLAGCAFFLALVGLYGVISYTAAQRTQEMGLRMALGASRGHVVGLVVRQGVGLACAGVAAGIAVSFAATRLLSTLLYGVTSRDPLTFVVSPALFLCFAFLASAIPALRATRVDPSEALRRE